MTTHLDFIRGASFIAKSAANWSGEVAIGLMGDLAQPDEPMNEDGLRRFRAEIMGQLNVITPDSKD